MRSILRQFVKRLLDTSGSGKIEEQPVIQSIAGHSQDTRQETMVQPQPQIQRLIQNIFTTPEHYGMDCEACMQEFDCLAERVVAGADLAEILPEFEEHIRRCHDCSEEFHALISILRAELDGKLS
jgi:hypothetical protein